MQWLDSGRGGLRLFSRMSRCRPVHEVSGAFTVVFEDEIAFL